MAPSSDRITRPLTPGYLERLKGWLLPRRTRCIGVEHVPLQGPALLVCNHVSEADGRLVAAHVRRPIHQGDIASPQQARLELQHGHLVCVFPEGTINRTGNLLPFKRGIDRIANGLDVPVIPVCVDDLGTIAFGQALPSTATAAEIRLAMTELGCVVAGEEQGPKDVLPRMFIRTAKRRWRSFCMTDSTGRPPLTFGRALVGSLLLSKWIRRQRLTASHIGLLLPSSVGGALANVAVSMTGKVPVNLNFTAGPDAMRHAIERCGIETVITSRMFLSKAGIAEVAGMVFLEDILKGIGGAEKLLMLLTAFVLPSGLLSRVYVNGADNRRTAAVIFSSGSTGVPKGVVLTHRNILANIASAARILQARPDDVMVGVLPFFHSFGFTGTLWFPLVTGFGTVYHPNPMDAKTIGELAGQHRATMLISTPTFCASYIRKCQPEQFAHLRYAIVGAEKLRESIATAFKERFGLALSEGYGCTEMSPIVAANLSLINDNGERYSAAPFGTVGQPIPGVAAKVVDTVTGEGPLFDREGLLLVRGPNLMAGYLDEPEKTRDVIRGGWYVTGDIASIDEDGAIRITDRLSRFSKIAGEMVPHMKVEESLNASLAEPYYSVVTSVPDEARGERLVALYTDPETTPQQLWERLCQSDMPRLWLPKREDLRFVEAIPTLGTGKVDLRAVRQLAQELSA